MKIGLLHTIVRLDEKMLFDEFKSKGVEVERVDDREMVLDLEKSQHSFDVLLDRCISQTHSLYITEYLNQKGTPTVNSFDVSRLCGDKFSTTLALEKHKVPTLKTFTAFTPVQALKAIEELGYPCVMKPVLGSWARLLSKINDRDAAESLLEHKETLGNLYHNIYYIQEYVKKPGRDIRAFVVGDETIAAIYRNSEHWITNTARGGKASKCDVTPELSELCLKAAKAVAGKEGAILAMDVFEHPEKGLVINEINHKMEFKNSVKPTGVNIPGKMVEFVLGTAKR
ncbi:MAG TPA: lysine biosynthesis protein LysX [archaeon]|nr:lysine biosynthesis protein LysX [archaeon]